MSQVADFRFPSRFIQVVRRADFDNPLLEDVDKVFLAVAAIHFYRVEGRPGRGEMTVYITDVKGEEWVLAGLDSEIGNVLEALDYESE